MPWKGNDAPTWAWYDYLANRIIFWYDLVKFSKTSWH